MAGGYRLRISAKPPSPQTGAWRRDLPVRRPVTPPAVHRCAGLLTQRKGWRLRPISTIAAFCWVLLSMRLMTRGHLDAPRRPAPAAVLGRSR